MIEMMKGVDSKDKIKDLFDKYPDEKDTMI